MPTRSSENGATAVADAPVADARLPRVEARNVWKEYRLGQTVSLQNTARYISGRVTGRWEPTPRFAAVEDVSFDVGVGECFAIVGSNGSGKTTVAKLLAGITRPSGGRIVVRGRTVPLLSSAAGFSTELTGTENVSLFGMLLGLGRREVRDAMPRIADFGGIDRDHMGTPVKRYSLGQRARLAFATALCLPAEIFIFDEALATADDEFKGKCVAEIHDLVARGATVIFLSHELSLVQLVCTRGMWMDHGKLRMMAEIDELASTYASSHAYAQQLPRKK